MKKSTDLVTFAPTKKITVNQALPYTLFLDRDGVINHRIPGSYVKYWEEFEFIEGSIEAIAACMGLFNRIVVVTNQQGIGKEYMTTAQLNAVHAQMLRAISEAGGHIDKVYFSPELATTNPISRKPNPGMGHQAKADFPEIDFTKSIMVGDSLSDMGFGEGLGMTNIFIATKAEDLAKRKTMDSVPKIDYEVMQLSEIVPIVKQVIMNR